MNGGLFAQLSAQPAWGEKYFQVGDLDRVVVRLGVYASGEGVGGSW